MLVPHVQRRQIQLPTTVAPRHRRGLEQRVALLEHPVVVRAHPRHPRRPGRDQLVQKAAPLTRIALDQRQILRREQHRPHDAQHVPRPDLRRPVDTGPIRAPGVQLQLHQLLPLALHHLGTDDRPLRPHPHQGRVGGDPVTAEGRQIADRLDQIGLPLPVGPHESRHARIERNLDPGVRAEVGQRQMRNVHGCAPTSPGCLLRS